MRPQGKTEQPFVDSFGRTWLTPRKVRSISAGLRAVGSRGIEASIEVGDAFNKLQRVLCGAGLNFLESGDSWWKNPRTGKYFDICIDPENKCVVVTEFIPAPDGKGMVVVG